MDIISKGKGIWQAGEIWIAQEDFLVDHFVRIDLDDPLLHWGRVYQSYQDCIARGERFLSLSLGIPSEYHSLQSDVEKSAKLAHSLNIRLLLEISDVFLMKARSIQSAFAVSETKEYPLQGQLEAYFNEMESPLYRERVEGLIALEAKGPSMGHQSEYEKERVKLLFALQRNFQDQSESLDRVAKGATEMSDLSNDLSRIAQDAKALALLCRGVESLPFEKKASMWLFMLEEFDLKPLLIGKPDQKEIHQALQILYAL